MKLLVDDNRWDSIIVDDNRWQSMIIDDSRWQSMAIEKRKIFVHRLVIDFRYQSINCSRLFSIAIDCYRLSVSSIDQAGIFKIWIEMLRQTTSTGWGHWNFSFPQVCEVETKRKHRWPKLANEHPYTYGSIHGMRQLKCKDLYRKTIMLSFCGNL